MSVFSFKVYFERIPFHVYAMPSVTSYYQVHVENRTAANQFKIRWKGPVTDASVLATVQLIPKLGETKANALLQRFHSEYFCTKLFNTNTLKS